MSVAHRFFLTTTIVLIAAMTGAAAPPAAGSMLRPLPGGVDPQHQGVLPPPLPAVAGGQQQGGAPPPLPAVAEASAPAPFGEWLEGVRKEAAARGISEATVERALSGIEPVPVIVERDRTQAERTLSLDQYLKRRLDRKTIRTARQMAGAHAAILGRVSREYGVPASLLVSVWGLESNFGRFSGVRPTIGALATLAYDNRRAAMFREELFNALRILDRGDVSLEQLKGSWAGAMGQPQFMPSTYLRFAQDFDGDGRTDIWRSNPDTFASIANFLRQQGWEAGAPWGRSVKLSTSADERIREGVAMRASGCEALRQMTEALPWSQWRKMGVTSEGGRPGPAPTTLASLVRAGPRNFLVFGNYHALLQYNCAHAYALSVGLLSDMVRTGRVAPDRAKASGPSARPKATVSGKKAKAQAKTTKAPAKPSKPVAKKRARTGQA